MKGSDTAGVNAMVPGTRVDCVIGLARVSDFSVAVEVLQAKIMTFVNQVAEIVHGVTSEFHGAPNKNNGETFLIVWRIQEADSDDDFHRQIMGEQVAVDEQSVPETTRRIAEMSVVAFAKIIGSLHRSKKLAEYRAHPGLQLRLGSKCRVNLTCGLHQGWAIEGAVGSEYKIDASYLSPNVSITASVERATQIYGVSLIVAQSVVNLCGQALVSKCRLIDNVIITGSVHPMQLFCVDLDTLAVQVSRAAPLAITWNTRNRFKARQYLELEKEDRLRESNFAQFFVDDPVLADMRTRYTTDFFQLFNMGYQNYAEGEWQVARRMLLRTKTFLGYEDGPSIALLRFMEKDHFEAPRKWQGIRELDQKQVQVQDT